MTPWRPTWAAPGWRAALRLAVRDATRNKAPALLVVALIGLPVVAVAALDIGYRTYQLDPDETVAREVGTADVALYRGEYPRVRQGPDAWLGNVGTAGRSGTEPSAAATRAAVTTLLPRGSRVIGRRVAAQPLVFRTPAGLGQAGFVGLDYADSIARGLVDQQTGRAPRGAGEVALTAALATATGLHVGDRLHSVDPARSFTVVGTVESTSSRTEQAVYALPAAVTDPGAPSIFGRPAEAGVTWFARTPAPVTWPQVRAANRQGFLAFSREVYLHPDAAARAAAASFDESGGGADTEVIAGSTLLSGMALLEVVLLAGPAFAVGAKRRRRDLALVVANGGTARDLRRIVLANGLLLGLVAGVGGALLAVGAAAAGLPLVRTALDRRPGASDVRPGELALAAGLGLLAALLASVVPARAAARTDPVAALAGRPSRVPLRARVPILAIVVMALGVLIGLGSSTLGGSDGALGILAGTALLEIGLIILTPVLLSGVARSGRHLPLALRLATRDAGRNRSSATPAVAAVMASVVGATGILIAVASLEDQGRRGYAPILPADAVSVVLDNRDVPAAQRAATVLRDELPTRSVAVLHAPSTACPSGTPSCRLVGLEPRGTGYATGVLPSVVIDDGSATGALFGAAAARARTALRAGRVVVLGSGTPLRDGEVTVNRTVIGATSDQNIQNSFRTRPVTVAGERIASSTGAQLALVVPTAVARRLGVDVSAAQVFAQLRRAPTDPQLQATRGRLHRILVNPSLAVEDGFHGRYATVRSLLVAFAVLVAVLAALIATGLANVDARPDLRTLAAVGAAPRTRRVLAMARGTVIAGTGALAGAAAGFLAPAAMVLGDTTTDDGAPLRFVVPWPGIAAVVVVIPLVVALIAGATTRARLPSV